MISLYLQCYTYLPELSDFMQEHGTHDRHEDLLGMTCMSTIIVVILFSAINT